ncbi:uncharacterized protein BROUX77_007884 [Berkeleyomyces rouxiae]|uniref:uncharacterized protein n=1 Tax=Berkeleyomyces rouxiae TaxID=2035830 RepID=UPI003B7D903A
MLQHVIDVHCASSESEIGHNIQRLFPGNIKISHNLPPTGMLKTFLDKLSIIPATNWAPVNPSMLCHPPQDFDSVGRPLSKPHVWASKTKDLLHGLLHHAWVIFSNSQLDKPLVSDRQFLAINVACIEFCAVAGAFPGAQKVLNVLDLSHMHVLRDSVHWGDPQCRICGFAFSSYTIGAIVAHCAATHRSRPWALEALRPPSRSILWCTRLLVRDERWLTKGIRLLDLIANIIEKCKEGVGYHSNETLLRHSRSYWERVISDEINDSNRRVYPLRPGRRDDLSSPPKFNPKLQYRRPQPDSPNNPPPGFDTVPHPRNHLLPSRPPISSQCSPFPSPSFPSLPTLTPFPSLPPCPLPTDELHHRLYAALCVPNSSELQCTWSDTGNSNSNNNNNTNNSDNGHGHGHGASPAAHKHRPHGRQTNMRRTAPFRAAPTVQPYSDANSIPLGPRRRLGGSAESVTLQPAPVPSTNVPPSTAPGPAMPPTVSRSTAPVVVPIFNAPAVTLPPVANCSSSSNNSAPVPTHSSAILWRAPRRDENWPGYGYLDTPGRQSLGHYPVHAAARVHKNKKKNNRKNYKKGHVWR